MLQVITSCHIYIDIIFRNYISLLELPHLVMQLFFKMGYNDVKLNVYNRKRFIYTSFLYIPYFATRVNDIINTS